MTHTWYEPYRAAILETDWTKMQERIQSAELAIRERQCILSLDHGFFLPLENCGRIYLQPIVGVQPDSPSVASVS